MSENRSQGPGAATIEVLSDAECHAVLGAQRLAVVCMSDAGEPYGVPMFYGFDPDSGDLYVGISEGRKTRVLDANPRVSVTVTEVGPGEGWRSVIVSGRAEWVQEGEGRQKAIQVLMAHNRKFRASGAAPAAPAPTGEVKMHQRNHAGGRMLRIAEATMSGRARR
ncbi:MAG TPA: pyridoxamine 5'-phosphate oxidase family protein [Gemmatimonadaceae bacterium]